MSARVCTTQQQPGHPQAASQLSHSSGAHPAESIMTSSRKGKLKKMEVHAVRLESQDERLWEAASALRDTCE